MSVSISGSLGLRGVDVGLGGRSSLGGKSKTAVAAASTSTRVPPQNNNSSFVPAPGDSKKMVDGGDNSVKLNLPPTPGGGGASNSSLPGGGNTSDGNVATPTTTSSSTVALNPPKVYGKIVLTSDNALLDKDNSSAETPSSQDGMEPDMEWETRVVGCELISSAGILLKLPQVSWFHSIKPRIKIECVF